MTTKIKKTSRFSKIRRALVAALIALLLFVTGRKANQLAADPLGEKECPPLDPLVEKIADDSASTLNIDVAGASLPWAQEGGTINDASCLNRTPVHGILQVSSEEEIRDALAYARDNGLKVSMAAVRHSMGGHAFFTNALVLDMLRFNQMSLDEESRILTVQSGATWHDIQNFLHPTYAVKAMQSSDIFSVGGSISVNAHGMDHRVGALGGTVRSMRLMMADGTVKRLSRDENRELFDLVIGGYGLFGVILDVELEVVENAIYESHRTLLDYRDFPALFADELAANEKIGLMYGHLSTAPQSFLQEMLLYTYEEVDAPDAEIAPLAEVSNTKLRRFVLNFSKLGDIPMRLKWFAEKRIEPLMESCTVSRNQAMGAGEACMVSRNEPMHDSVKYVQNNLPNDTDILHEYYVPRARFVEFVDGLRDIATTHDANILNASVRVVHQEHNFLNYATQDMFSVVLYINQETTPAANEKMRQVTAELIDLAINLDGAFFLPYQLYYTPEQLEQAYPNIDLFFAKKLRYDPEELLTNTFYEKYAK